MAHKRGVYPQDILNFKRLNMATTPPLLRGCLLAHRRRLNNYGKKKKRNRKDIIIKVNIITYCEILLLLSHLTQTAWPTKETAHIMVA